MPPQEPATPIVWVDPSRCAHVPANAHTAPDSCSGAARAVSRRYIADFVSKRERTKASAAFVGSSAMGMALGPLLARLFQHFPTLHFGPLTFNYITMGACAPQAPAGESVETASNLRCAHLGP